MSAALQLVERIRTEVRPIGEQILAHRYLLEHSNRASSPDDSFTGRRVMLQSYELMFWDAAARGLKVEIPVKIGTRTPDMSQICPG